MNKIQLVEFFPDMTYAMLHPSGDEAHIERVVEAYAAIAAHAAAIRPGFQPCFHNHYDSNIEPPISLTCNQIVERVFNPHTSTKEI